MKSALGRAACLATGLLMCHAALAQLQGRSVGNVLKFWASTNGIAWRQVHSVSWTHDFDYLWIRMLGSSTPGEVSRHLVDFIRVNDPRFDQLV